MTFCNYKDERGCIDIITNKLYQFFEFILPIIWGGGGGGGGRITLIIKIVEIQTTDHMCCRFL